MSLNTILTAEFWSPASNALVFLSTASVLIGLVLEGEWEWSLPLLFHQSVRATEPLSDWRKKLGQTLVTLGVAGELLFGVTAFVTTSVVDNRQKRLLTSAVNEQTNLERLIAGRQIVNGPTLDKLRAFAGTPIWVASIGSTSLPGYDTIFENAVMFPKIIEEASHFADSFSELEPLAGWKFHRVNDPISWAEASKLSGVTVYSWRPLQNKKPSPAEQRAWAAGDILVAYLRSDLLLGRTTHKPLQIESPPFNKWSSVPPHDVVVVFVGQNNPEAELTEWLRQRGHAP